MKESAVDIAGHRNSGKTCDNFRGKPVVWDGHACAGASVHPGVFRTMCGKYDVPANAAHVGHAGEIVCAKCKAVATS